MKYDYMVKVRGQYYPAGVEIPELKLDEEQQRVQTESQSEEQRKDGADAEPAKQTAKRGRKPAVSQ